MKRWRYRSTNVIYLRLDEYKAAEPGKIIEKLINKTEFDFNKCSDCVGQKRNPIEKILNGTKTPTSVHQTKLK